METSPQAALTPSLSRTRERGRRLHHLSLARLREREGPAAQRWEGEGRFANQSTL